ncbi:DNA polymerase III subunit delta' [Phaeobacter gallaeciensis]|uniref:DNA polymerase III subunit delta n=2 Tax=Roseobacteraceae TaxID=2854170 RepID=A0A366WQJ6_9RHOB|nr:MULTISPECIES: DNA polymerase III subunit delta' [Roseobacteraceae]MBT3143088.1 DNA polymerase III subunit delta' [Falsiruegeria litorea]MBT8166808.1 DNA polymerase III subunit delta' [Falsiruegeria litorea]RBW51613.1 DNA polymerase III subunit delta' [Phaeobacter gallaeciensis]
MSDDIPAPDQAPGAPHPRETVRLFGQDAAEAEFLTAFNSERLHHGWMFTGPQGVGKATLAWRIALFLLANPPADNDGLFGAPPAPTSLDISPDHPVFHRIQAGAEPGLASITRSLNDNGKLRKEIVVDDVRKLGRFFGLSSTDGGRRVVIVDSADEMNTSAANALLKMLEEPPARTTLLLISHQPSRLLPTIRSRCRTLRLGPLNASDMQAALEQANAQVPDNPDHLAALAAGSVGAALRLLNLGGLQIYSELIGILGTMPRLDRKRAMALADAAAQRNAADKFELLLSLIDIVLARLARTGATGQPPYPEAAHGEAEVLAKLAPEPRKGRMWAEIATTITARTRHGQAVNLDPASLVLDTVFKMQETAAG